MLEALQEVDVRPPLVAVLRARPKFRLLIENSLRALRRKSGGHRSEIACRINRTMTGTRSPPPLSPTARPPAPRAPHGAAQSPPLFARAGQLHARRRRAAAVGAGRSSRGPPHGTRTSCAAATGCAGARRRQQVASRASDSPHEAPLALVRKSLDLRDVARDVRACRAVLRAGLRGESCRRQSSRAISAAK